MKITAAMLSSILFPSVATAKAWTAAVDSGDCKKYSVQTGDTCWSIMRSTNATFAQILSWNSNLDKQCANLTELEGKDICISNPEGDYAIPSNSNGIPTIITTTAPIPSPTPDETEDRCAQFHLVKEGEDCATFMTEYEITMKDFMFLNPHVWENCTNVYLDYYYCVRPVGYISTYPGYLPPTSTREFVKTPTTKLPIVADPLARYVRHDPVIPIANKTRRDCSQYLYMSNFTETPSLENCWAAAMLYDISREELVLWNPSLAQGNDSGTETSEYTYPCSMVESVSYCVGLESSTASPIPEETAPPSPRGAGEIENCTRWFLAKDYLTCEDVLLTTSLTFDEFFFMNPSVKKDCTGLTIGTFYCISIDEDGSPPTSLPIPTPTATTTTTSTGTGISTPTPTQSGMVKTCNKFYYVESGDVCEDIAKENDISRADFDLWNPDVKSDCTGLVAEYYVCVGVYAPAPTPTTTSGSPGSTPTPTQTGMVKGCGEFHFVVEGDGCWAISDEYGIALDDFYDWNPAVKSDCSGLLTEFYVCVGLAN